MNLPCESYCEHGGCCELDEGHDGLHNSSYCTWDDAQAISKEEADARFTVKNPVLAPAVIGITDALWAAMREDES